MPQVLDIEQSMLLLELDPPFDKRAVQLARRRLAKQWHPDIAPPGRQFEHERHLKAINEAADQLEQLAEQSRGGAFRQRRQGQRRGRTQRRRRGGPPRLRGGAARPAHDADRAEHDPFGDRTPDHSVVHRYARCLSYPEWGVGIVTGIYFSGDGDEVQQWARVKFQVGVRTVPAGSLQFVDFSTRTRPPTASSASSPPRSTRWPRATTRRPRSGSSTPATPSRATRPCCG